MTFDSFTQTYGLAVIVFAWWSLMRRGYNKKNRQKKFTWEAEDFKDTKKKRWKW